MTNILPEPSGGFPPIVALTTYMSSWKFFSKVVSRDLMAFSMLRESWFTLTITRLSLFLMGAGDAFDPVETLLSSAVADTITVTQDSHRINHMIRDECILKGKLFANYLLHPSQTIRTDQKQYGLKTFTREVKLYPRLTNQRAVFFIAV